MSIGIFTIGFVVGYAVGGLVASLTIFWLVTSWRRGRRREIDLREGYAADSAPSDAPARRSHHHEPLV